MVKKLEDLFLARIDHGVQLANRAITPNSFTIKQLLALPMSTWLLDQSGATIAINTEGIQVCGFESLEHALGHSIEAVSQKQSADVLIDNCKQTIQRDEIKLFDETQIRKDNIIQQFISLKSPLYDESHNIIGVCGFSIVVGRHSIADSLNILSQLSLLSPASVKPDPLAALHLPPREKQCLQLICKGYTAKMIAKKLALSFRTVEGYIETLKRRLGAQSKSELMALAADLYGI
jgi:DNA-binding CsgD family transcriptional regulator